MNTDYLWVGQQHKRPNTTVAIAVLPNKVDIAARLLDPMAEPPNSAYPPTTNATTLLTASKHIQHVNPQGTTSAIRSAQYA